MNNQTCKQQVVHSAAPNSVRCYLLTLALVGADLVLLIAIEVLPIWS